MAQPVGAADLRERIETTLLSNIDGTFEWLVNPSTRPIVLAAGETESYLLTVTADGGRGEGFAKRLVVERGQRIDLGTVVVG